MKVVGLSGWSNSGKTTLLEQLIARMRLHGQRVSVVKHAHHAFDIDQPGKDSWRHRQAGAFEVVIASSRRLAKLREYELDVEPTAHQLIAELVDCDWAFVEGFKHADLLKLEVWRAENGKPVQYPDDPYVVAICTDRPEALPVPTRLPLLDLNDPEAVVEYLLRTADRYEYRAPSHLDPAGEAAAAEPGPGADDAARRRPPVRRD